MRFLYLSIPLSLCIHTACAAQNEPDENSLHGTIYVAPIIAPDYVGSDEYRVTPFGGFQLQYKQFFLRTEGSGLVANLLPIDHVMLGPAANFRIGRRPKDIKSVAIGALGEIDDAWEVGGFAGLGFPDLMTPGDTFEITAKALFDVSDVHEGYTIQPAITYRVPVSRSLTLGFGVNATYGDDAYMNRYFGVDTDGAFASGLPVYSAEGGFQDVGVLINGNFSLGGGLGLFGAAGYNKLLGDAKNSPIVAIEGDSNQFFGSAGISFSF